MVGKDKKGQRTKGNVKVKALYYISSFGFVFFEMWAKVRKHTGTRDEINRWFSFLCNC